MNALAIIVALVAAALGHYVFSFQRFTLNVARLNEGPVPEVQTLMTPASMGALGWISTLSEFCASVLLWVVFGWPYAIGYFVFVFGIMAMLPLVRSQRFYTLALGELQRHYESTEDQDLRAIFDNLRQLIQAN